jgi:ADP-ribosylglycohydrolase
LALCLAESLITKEGFDPEDQMIRYLQWFHEGHLSSTGTCFDIGNTTRTALQSFEKSGNPYSGPEDSWQAGNGSIMRLGAIPLFFASNPELGLARAADSSRTTHGAITAIDACRYLAALIIGAVNGAGKEDLLSPYFCPVENYWTAYPLCPEVGEIAAGSFKEKQPPEILGSGYVIESLEAALWAFYHSNNFKDGCLLAVNLGDDADTTAAVYGQIAGAYYGKQNIPEEWLRKLSMRTMIESFADDLHRLAQISL